MAGSSGKVSKHHPERNSRKCEGEFRQDDTALTSFPEAFFIASTISSTEYPVPVPVPRRTVRDERGGGGGLRLALNLF